jgi:Fic family protein
MQRAYGGTIIEVSDYDEHTDRYNRDLYIITAEQDLSTEIASILVQHNLRHG